MQSSNLMLGFLYLVQALTPEEQTATSQEEKAIERINDALQEAIKAVKHYQSEKRRKHAV